MWLNKIILICILLVGCEKEPIKLDPPKILKNYQDKVKTISKPILIKRRMKKKKSFRFYKILKTKKPKI